MGVSDFSVYTDLKACTIKMLSAAKAEDWDNMLLQSQFFAELSSNLPMIQWSTLTSLEQQQLAELLQECNQNVQELEQRAISQRGELAALLQNMYNTGKLQRAYDV
ncbi:flagellar protein FliT [Iodobacter ciconiae]|uniref:Flagellar protein FliT n=1 Tax=Iodobacter ciconiae TaxID=2496266 RepID=A0A3S8ZQQ0_9NEIS|nr:flagellar protein FliT [Iodobacter ciconiae]AZN35794.1 flagellar protein FliT [Iodobacter ciconiae]